MSIEELLMKVLLGGGGVGAIATYFWLQLEKVWEWGAARDKTMKRALVSILCFLLVQVFYWFAVWLALIKMPVSPQDWFSQTFLYTTFAFGGSTYFHGIFDDDSDPVVRYWGK